MLIIEQIVLGILFLITAIICFTPLTLLISKKWELDSLERVVISTILGMTLFTLCAYILIFFHLRFLMYLFPIIGAVTLLKFRKNLFSLRFNIKYKSFFLIVFLIGIIGQVAINAPSGFSYKDGIYFWSSHGHDGIWHLTLMQQMHKNTFPFQNPELAGYRLQNYHLFVDLLMSEFSRLFPFSSLDIYFRFMPIFFSVFLGLSGFIFVKRWSHQELAGIWAMIFIYFAGSFGYLLYVPTHQSLGGEAIFWVSQTQSVLGNPPHAAAFIITTCFLFVLYQYLKTRKWLYFLLGTLFGGVVIEFKVYAGVLILGGLLILSLYEILFEKFFKTAMLFITTLLLALGVYLPNSANSQDFLVWQPWWFIRTMVVAPDRLNWLDLELRRQTYIAESNWKRVIQLELMAFFIFLIGNLGMRFLGFWIIFKNLRDNVFRSPFNLFFLVVTITSFFIPVFFLQKGVAWNTIQFNQYFLLFFSFYAAIAVVKLLTYIKGYLLKYLIALIIILAAVPTQLGLLWQFYSNPPLSKISNEELQALNFLKNHTNQNDIILTAPFNKYKKYDYKNPPIPIFSWYDSGYVSAFSDRRTLISDEEQVSIMGYDTGRLLKEREDIFQISNNKLINDFIKKYQVGYIYLAWDQKFATDSAYLNADLVFENKDAKIFKVK